MQTSGKNQGNGSDLAGLSPTTDAGTKVLASAVYADPVQRRTSKWVRRTHALLGIVSAFNLLLLIGTGFLLQHASLLHLDERVVPRRILPSFYRPQDGVHGVRADIFVTDLHSGRLFGVAGTLTLDVVTLAWLILLTTGVVMYFSRQRAKQRAQERDGNSEEDD